MSSSTWSGSKVRWQDNVMRSPRILEVECVCVQHDGSSCQLIGRLQRDTITCSWFVPVVCYVRDEDKHKGIQPRQHVWLFMDANGKDVASALVFSLTK